MTIRKFYDSSAGDGASGGITADIAARIRSGQSDPAPAATPAQTPNQDTPAVPASTPATGAPNEPAATPTEPAAPAQTPSTPAAAPATEATPKPAEQTKSWKEILKEQKADRLEILKEAGVDEFTLNLMKVRENGGDVTKYIKAQTNDWDKVSDVALLKDDLRSQFPGISDDDFDLLVENEIFGKYNQTDEADPKLKRLGEIQMKRQADAIRTARKAEDAQFQIPEYHPEDTQAKVLLEQKAKQDALVRFVSESSATKALQTNGFVTAGAGQETVNVPTDPAKILEFTHDPNTFFGLFRNQDGSLNLETWYKAAAFAANPAKYEQDLINYGKTLGIKAESDTIHSIPKPGDTPAAPVTETMREAIERLNRQRN